MKFKLMYPALGIFYIKRELNSTDELRNENEDMVHCYMQVGLYLGVNVIRNKILFKRMSFVSE